MCTGRRHGILAADNGRNSTLMVVILAVRKHVRRVPGFDVAGVNASGRPTATELRAAAQSSVQLDSTARLYVVGAEFELRTVDTPWNCACRLRRTLNTSVASSQDTTRDSRDVRTTAYISILAQLWFDAAALWRLHTVGNSTVLQRTANYCTAIRTGHV